MSHFLLDLNGAEYYELLERRIDDMVACWRDRRDRPHDQTGLDRYVATRNDLGFCPPANEAVRLTSALTGGDYVVTLDGQMFDQNLVDRLVARIAESGGIGEGSDA